jgi:hypothetical protein
MTGIANDIDQHDKMATINDEKSIGGSDTSPQTEKIEYVATHQTGRSTLNEDFEFTFAKFLAVVVGSSPMSKSNIWPQY